MYSAVIFPWWGGGQPPSPGERGVNAAVRGGGGGVEGLIVRIMFSQVLIRVWREVLEFIIHPTGGGHGPGRLPAPEPASWLY